MSHPAWQRTEAINAAFSPLLKDLLNHLSTPDTGAEWLKEAMAKQKRVYDQMVLNELQGYELALEPSTIDVWSILWDKWVAWCCKVELSLAKEHAQLSKLACGNIGQELCVRGPPDVLKCFPKPPLKVRYDYHDGRLTFSHRSGYPMVWIGESLRLKLSKIEGVSVSWAPGGSSWSAIMGLELAVKGLERDASYVLVANMVEEHCGPHSISLGRKDPATSSYRFVMDSASAVQEILYKTVPHLGKHISLVHSFHLWETGKPALKLQLPREQRSYGIEEHDLRRFERDLCAVLSHFCDVQKRRKYGEPDFSLFRQDTAVQESEDLSQATPVRALKAAIDSEDYCLLEFTSTRLVEMLQKDNISSKIYIDDMPPSLVDHLKLEVLRTLDGLSSPPPSFDWEACLALFGSQLTRQATVGIHLSQDGNVPSFGSLLDVVFGRQGRLLLLAGAGGPAQLFAAACSNVFYSWNVSRDVSALTNPAEFGAKVAFLVAFTPDQLVEAALRTMKPGSLVLAIGAPLMDTNSVVLARLACIKLDHFLYSIG